jgi:hypothetical protein
VAAGKSQNQEWPFAAVSGCAARPVVKRALRELTLGQVSTQAVTDI